MTTNPIIQTGQGDACVASGVKSMGTCIPIHEAFQELNSWSKKLAQSLSVPEITGKVYVTIDPAPVYGVRAWFSFADLPLGYVIVVYSPYPGEVEIKCDTVIQELEHSRPGKFQLGSIECAVAWTQNLARKLAALEQFWDSYQIVTAAEARSVRLEK